jgi:hypothetical protein
VTLLQSILSTISAEYEFSAQNCSTKENDFFSNGQFPTTWEKHNLGKSLWPWENAAPLEDQLSSILPASRSRLSVLNQSKSSCVASGYSDEYPTSTIVSRGEPHFSGSALDPPLGVCDDTELLALSVPINASVTGVEYSGFQKDDSDRSFLDLLLFSEIAAKAIYPPPQHLPLTGAVQGAPSPDCGMTPALELPERY